MTLSRDELNALRFGVLRDVKTGEILEKPPMPRMRTVIQGGWVWAEIENDPDEPPMTWGPVPPTMQDR